MKRATKKKSPPVSIQLPDALLKRAEEEAVRRGVSRSAVIRWALVHYFESADVKTAV